MKKGSVITCDKCYNIFTKQTKTENDLTCNSCKKLIRNHPEQLTKDITKTEMELLKKAFQ